MQTQKIQNKIRRISVLLATIVTSITLSTPVKADVQALQTYYSAVPVNVQTWLVNHRVNIALLNEDDFKAYALLNGVPCPDTLKGFCLRRRTNGILTQQIVILEGYESCVVHEIGHAISCYQDKWAYWESDPLFLQIYKMEKSWLDMYPDAIYYAGSPEEYFAESFFRYIFNPDVMVQKAPMTYNYINAVVQLTQD